ncbi:hypothetical protein VPH35_123225 [Triticum aestivum]
MSKKGEETPADGKMDELLDSVSLNYLIPNEVENFMTSIENVQHSSSEHEGQNDDFEANIIEQDDEHIGKILLILLLHAKTLVMSYQKTHRRFRFLRASRNK